MRRGGGEGKVVQRPLSLICIYMYIRLWDVYNYLRELVESSQKSRK